MIKTATFVGMLETMIIDTPGLVWCIHFQDIVEQ